MSSIDDFESALWEWGQTICNEQRPSKWWARDEIEAARPFLAPGDRARLAASEAVATEYEEQYLETACWVMYHNKSRAVATTWGYTPLPNKMFRTAPVCVIAQVYGDEAGATLARQFSFEPRRPTEDSHIMDYRFPGGNACIVLAGDIDASYYCIAVAWCLDRELTDQLPMAFHYS